MASPAERSQQNGSSSGQPGAGEPTEVLAGSIERVTFRNPANGFCVLRIKASGHRELQQLLNPDPTEQVERFGRRVALAEQSHLRSGRAIYDERKP